MPFLHGVETTVVNAGPVPVTVVNSAVIALLGTAPKGPVNTLTLVTSATDAAQFGKKVAGHNIPHALEAIFKQGAGSVLVVNVANPAATTNQATVTAESLVVANRAVKATYAPFGGTFTLTNSGGNTTYTAGTDYSIDELGNVTILAAVGTIAEGATLKATYKRFDVTTVDTAQLTGAITDNTKTGSKLFEDAFNSLGLKPKIIICPKHVEVKAVATLLLTMADYYKAIALIDAPVTTTPAGAVTGRGTTDPINFYTSNERAYLLYPHLNVFNDVLNANELQPYSQFMAGVIAATDINEGYHVSPSNHEIKGIVGPEVSLSFALNDTSCQTNTLNAAGITCYASGFGTGYRTWGNRSAAYPTSTKITNFIPVRRTADVLHESVENAMLPFIDKPINQATIDTIRETVNAFIRKLIGKGALVDGLCTYDKAKNPPTEIAAGHLTFDLTFVPPAPAERITFESFIDINLLTKLT